MKKIIFETFFQDYVVTSNGIWVGNGVSEQSVLKVTTYNKQQTANIGNKFGWVFKSGNVELTKLLNCEGDSDNEEQSVD